MMKNKIRKSILDKYNLKEKEYCLLTMHRPSNVDHLKTRDLNIDFINKVSKKIKVICPVHHRMKKMVAKLENENFMELTLSLDDFLSLENYAKFVITDSGGVQEETFS